LPFNKLVIRDPLGRGTIERPPNRRCPRAMSLSPLIGTRLIRDPRSSQRDPSDLLDSNDMGISGSFDFAIPDLVKPQ